PLSDPPSFPIRRSSDLPRAQSPENLISELHRYFFIASVFAAGAATQAPLPSFPPFSSHFIFAFSQSTLFAGVDGAVCAKATGVKAAGANVGAPGRVILG